MATREKNIWILLVFLLAGLVVGGLLGRLASSVSKLTFGLMFKINIASIIGMVLSIFIYKKI